MKDSGKNKFGPYDCPKCGSPAEDFDGTFYKVVDGKAIFDLSDWDIIETGLPIPDEYYPKFGARESAHNLDYRGYNWEETHKCPHCGEIFTYINSSY